MRPGAFTLDVMETILHRAGYRCDRCGLRAEHNGQFHHRTPRRMGGTSRTDLGLPSNGLLLHPDCHAYIESHRKVAAQLGFLVGYGTLPKDAPVMLWSGWHWLTDDGRAIKIHGVPPVHPSSMSDADGVEDAGSSEVAGGGEPVVGGVGVAPPVDVVGLAADDVSEVES